MKRGWVTRIIWWKSSERHKLSNKNSIFSKVIFQEWGQRKFRKIKNRAFTTKDISKEGNLKDIFLAESGKAEMEKRMVCIWLNYAQVGGFVGGERGRIRLELTPKKTTRYIRMHLSELKHLKSFCCSEEEKQKY